MVLRMPRPTSRADSRNHQFQAHVPSDLAARLKGQQAVLTLPPETPGADELVVTTTFGRVVKFSLKTTNKVVAANRNSAAVSQLTALYQGLRAGPRSLSNRETIAYSGEVYRLFVERFQENPGTPELWQAVKAFNRAVKEGRLVTSLGMRPDDIQRHLEAAQETFGAALTTGVNAMPRGAVGLPEALEERFGWLVDWVLAKHGLIVDSDSRARLMVASVQASDLAAIELKKNARGDYSPDANAQRFPPIESIKKASSSGTDKKVTLTGILEAWWKEAKATGRKPSTYESYSNTTSNLVAYLGHDDATMVTPEHIVGFKDHRLASINPRTNKPISAKTVKDSDLSGLKTLFGWAMNNRRLPSNPAQGITIKLGKQRITRSKGFTDAEAKALLEAADAQKRGQQQQRTYDAKRWVPWLCAYTGARVGEIAQLRKEDIRQMDGHWTIHISPEAGTVKTDQARDVVLHEHLIEKGFPAFAASCKSGHLFLKPGEDGAVLGPLQAVKNRLAETARDTVKDKGVMPNHGWRHRFKTVARSVGMDGRVVDAIQGHAPRTAGDDYGDVTVQAMALAMQKFPRQA